MRMETGKRIVQSWNAKSPLEQEAACRRSSNFSMKDSSRKCSWKIQKGKLQELQITRKLKTWTNTQDQHGPTWTTAFQTQIIFKGAMFTILIKYAVLALRISLHVPWPACAGPRIASGATSPWLHTSHSALRQIRFYLPSLRLWRGRSSACCTEDAEGMKIKG